MEWYDADLHAALSRWSLRRLGDKATALTNRSAVWKVALPDGRVAALKVLHPNAPRAEFQGPRVLDAWGGAGMVTCLAASGRLQLLEWVDGPSLIEIAADQGDRAANDVLCDVIAALHSRAPVPGDYATDIMTWVAPLFTALPRLVTEPESRRSVIAARTLAIGLIGAMGPPRLLHGDIHHANVRLADRGWLAFDPKGILADAAFETCNAFRNPPGAADMVCDPARIAALSDLFEDRLGLSPKRMLGWAVVKCALAILGALNGQRMPRTDLRLLPVLQEIEGRL